MGPAGELHDRTDMARFMIAVPGSVAWEADPRRRPRLMGQHFSHHPGWRLFAGSR
jgi:hypothetical protein